MKNKIICNNKYELCEDCRRVFVPVTSSLTYGKRLCSNCSFISRRPSLISSENATTIREAV